MKRAWFPGLRGVERAQSTEALDYKYIATARRTVVVEPTAESATVNLKPGNG